MILIVRIISLAIAGFAAAVVGSGAEIVLSDGGKRLELGPAGLNIRDVIDFLGQPDDLNLPVVFPIKNYVVTDCTLVFAEKGVIVRFEKTENYGDPVVRDVFLFLRQTPFGGRTLAETKIKAGTHDDSLDSLFGRNDVKHREFDRLYMWQTPSAQMKQKIEEETGLRLPTTVPIVPSWEGCEAVSHQVSGWAWEVQELGASSDQGRFAFRLRFGGKMGESVPREEIKIDSQIDVRRPRQ